VRTAPRYGSDLVVDLLRAVGIEHVALNPGATFRGLHDSLVNYGGPELVLTTHEEIAVALAHGYAKARGRPMAAVVHDIVGLQHASMAIFNAFCDRAPVLVLGASGPMDATRRRPWIDWIHTALVQGTQVRDYVKLDDQPASVRAIPEAFLRAWRVARTPPQGPVYLCLDAALQEQPLDAPVPLPDVARFEPPAPPHADPRAIEEAARRLVEARFPVIVAESLGRFPGTTERLCRLAERLGAPLVDLAGESQGGPSVPGDHPLDMSDARREVVSEADVLLALEVTSFLTALGETDRSTREVRLLNAGARVISISLDDYAFRSWAQTFQSLAPVDVPIAADTASALPSLLAAVEDRLARDPSSLERRSRADRIAARHAALRREWSATVRLERSARPLAPSVLAAEVWEAIKGEDWVLANGTGKGWARRLWDWRPERSYGGSGGAGLGYGLPAALGVTLAHRWQRRGAPGGDGQSARAARREQGGRHPHRRPAAGFREDRPGLRSPRRGTHRHGGRGGPGHSAGAPRRQGRRPASARRRDHAVGGVVPGPGSPTVRGAGAPMGPRSHKTLSPRRVT
jgi:thiamine pyrophosphate-dependent acetolactate synthase large subunit-like protein